MSTKTIDVIKEGTIFRSKVDDGNHVLRADGIQEVTSDNKFLFGLAMDMVAPPVKSVVVFCTELKTDGTGIMILDEYLSDDIVILDDTEKVNNSVTHPEHYTKNTMECLEFITTYRLDYFVGNAVKYVWRHKHKNGEEDLRKAVYYLSERLKCDSSWNVRGVDFEYQNIDHTKLEDMDSVQLAILYSLSLLMTLDGKDKLDRITATLKLLEVYIHEQYN